MQNHYNVNQYIKEYKVAEAWSVCESSFCVDRGGEADWQSTLWSTLCVNHWSGGVDQWLTWRGLTVNISCENAITYCQSKGLMISSQYFAWKDIAYCQSQAYFAWKDDPRGAGEPQRTMLPHYLSVKHGVTTSMFNQFEPTALH